MQINTPVFQGTRNKDILQDRYVPRVMVDEVTWDKSDFNQGIRTPVISVSENDSYDGDVVTVEDDGHMYDFWVNELEE